MNPAHSDDQASVAAPSQKTVLVNVRVFDGYKVGDATTVAIEGDKIIASSDVAGAQMVDGEGGVLIPGLINSHCHLEYEAKLKTLPTYGVTTALDMGAKAATLHDMKAVAGKKGLSDYRGAGEQATSQISNIDSRNMITGTSMAKRWVEDRLHEGSDYIKLIADNPFGPQPSLEMLTDVATAAREFGKMTIAHAVSRKGQQRAQDAKVDFITHVPLEEALDDDFVQKMVAEKRCAIPTLIMMKMVAEAFSRGDRAFRTGEEKLALSSANKSVKLMHDAGVPILAGDDSNSNPHAPASPEVGHALHQELKLLVDAGLSPTDALRAATVIPAEEFNLRDRGVIAPGCRADLVLLKEDPTVDISNIGSIKQVWCNGVSWKPE